MRASRYLVAALLLGTLACNDLLETDGVDSGVINVPTYSNGSGFFLVNPLAVFYEDASLTFPQPTTGACGTIPFDPDESGVLLSGFPTMNVGPHLVANLPASEDTLYRELDSGFQLYRPSAVGGILHTPGDTLTVTVPGDLGFPAGVIRVRTAEAFEMADVAVPAVNDPLTVTWTPAPLAGSVMRYSLRYASERSIGDLDEQLVCIFEDDGEGTIDASFLQGWVNATGGQRQVVATRIRSANAELSEKARLTMLSTFQVPTPPFIP